MGIIHGCNTVWQTNADILTNCALNQKSTKRKAQNF